MRQFLKSSDLQLINGGYLSNGDGQPVCNHQFYTLQKHAEYVVTFAELAKGKNFTAKKVDTLSDLKQQVQEKLAEKATIFVQKPTLGDNSLTKQLAEEALNFMSFKEGSSKADKINNFLQQFTLLAEFEEFGLFFVDDVCKLNRIYTIQEIVNAVTATIDLLEAQ